MFGKLLKHEFAATWRIMLLLNVILLGAGVTGFLFAWFYSMQAERVSRRNGFSWSGTYSLISFMLFFVIALVAVNLIARIFLIVRYYKNLYTAEGYLTFTLPATTTEIISAKILTGILWNGLTLLLTVGAVALTVSGFAISSSELAELADLPSDFFSAFSIDETQILPLLIFTYVVSALTSILMYYFCITVGQLWAKHKIIGAILCYVVIAFINRIFSFVLALGTGYSRAFLFALPYGGSYLRTYQYTLIGTLVYTLVLAAIYYGGCVLVTQRRVNLD